MSAVDAWLVVAAWSAVAVAVGWLIGLMVRHRDRQIPVDPGARDRHPSHPDGVDRHAAEAKGVLGL